MAKQDNCIRIACILLAVVPVFGQSAFQNLVPGLNSLADATAVLSQPLPTSTTTQLEFRPPPGLSKLAVEIPPGSSTISRIQVSLANPVARSALQRQFGLPQTEDNSRIDTNGKLVEFYAGSALLALTYASGDASSGVERIDYHSQASFASASGISGFPAATSAQSFPNVSLLSANPPAVPQAAIAGVVGSTSGGGGVTVSLRTVLQQANLQPGEYASPTVLASVGLTITANAPGTPGVAGTGKLRVERVGPNEAHPTGTTTEAFLFGPGIGYNVLHCTTLVWNGKGLLIGFTITRPGVVGNASVPAWTMYAFDRLGKQLDSKGEGNLATGGFFQPATVASFTLSSTTPIARVVFCSHNGSSTYNALPLSAQ